MIHHPIYTFSEKVYRIFYFMQRDNLAGVNNDIVQRLRQNVRDKEREIEELTDMVIAKDGEIAELRSRLQAQSNNNIGGGQYEDMNQKIQARNVILNVNAPVGNTVGNASSQDVRALREQVDESVM